MKLILTSHDPSWKERFSSESCRLLQALGPNVIAIHHIGSTSIPDVLAKPVIDVLVEVRQIDQVDENTGQKCDLLYEAMGEYGIDGRRYFRRSRTGEFPAFHIHVFATNSEHVERHLAFRDYLLAHPGKAKEYSELKVKLSESGSASKSDYQAAKTPFIEACIKDATKWSRHSL